MTKLGIRRHVQFWILPQIQNRENTKRNLSLFLIYIQPIAMMEMECVIQVMWRGGNRPFLRKEREYSAASIRSAMLCKERSSEPTQNIARTLAFIASLEAKFSGNEGEFRLLSVWRYSDRTRLLFLLKSSAVAHIKPLPILQHTKIVG